LAVENHDQRLGEPEAYSTEEPNMILLLRPQDLEQPMCAMEFFAADIVIVIYRAQDVLGPVVRVNQEPGHVLGPVKGQPLEVFRAN
jgi:hypothetical protein